MSQTNLSTQPTIRWGILSTGSIATQFAIGLTFVPDAELKAVGSRTQASADRFAKQHNVPEAYGSYAALAAADVDVIYIATPHALHYENCMLCLNHGKHVLCEKPFTINSAEMEAVFAFAKQQQLFIMEAMWMRFIPAIATLEDLLAANTIGELRLLHADFGFRIKYDPSSRLLDPTVGGGALLDVGIYPLAVAQLLLGAPEEIHGVASIGETGVDEQCALTLRYANGRLATLSAAVRTQTPTEAWLYGTKGNIRVHSPMFRPTKLTITASTDLDEQSEAASAIKARAKRNVLLRKLFSTLMPTLRAVRNRLRRKTIRVPFTGNGYNYEASAVQDCLRQGLLECPRMPHAATRQSMQTMDLLRKNWNVTYPNDAFVAAKDGADA